MIFALIILAIILLALLKSYIVLSSGCYVVPHTVADRLFVVTGANSGIGLEACKELLRNGARVVMCTRNQEKAKAAIDDIYQEIPSADVKNVRLDLNSFSSVRQCAETLLEDYEQIDVLVNNAGISESEYHLTDDGLEATWQANHFGPFLLTYLLLDRLVESRARIVNVASLVHHFGSLKNFEKKIVEKDYFSGGLMVMPYTYCDTKLANVMFTRALHQRYRTKGITTNCLHPGVVRTGLFRHQPWYKKPLFWVVSVFFKNAKEGAQTILYLAASPTVAEQSGGYYSDCKPADISRQAGKDDLCDMLWERSLRICGIVSD